MNDKTLRILITVRSLLEQADRQSESDNQYQATAALIVLQDAVELALLAVMIEIGLDDQTAIEKYDFDGMIAALTKHGVKVPRSGTLKAMNKLRVTAKHYGELMEPISVRKHVANAKFVIDDVLKQTIQKPLSEVFLTELVDSLSSRKYLDEAVAAISSDNPGAALIAIRKAFFVEFEQPYCIYEFMGRPNALAILLGGYKAEYRKRNKTWIDQNVHTPFDYVQIDFDVWRMDALEWGINTQMLSNIRRLTPECVRLEYSGPWFTRIKAGYKENNETTENAVLCLDMTIDAIRKKSEHQKLSRSPRNDAPFETPAAYIGQVVFARPETSSSTVTVLLEGDSYNVLERLTGFDPAKSFYRVTVTRDGQEIPLRGFVELIADEPLNE